MDRGVNICAPKIGLSASSLAAMLSTVKSPDARSGQNQSLRRAVFLWPAADGAPAWAALSMLLNTVHAVCDAGHCGSPQRRREEHAAGGIAHWVKATAPPRRTAGGLWQYVM